MPLVNRTARAVRGWLGGGTLELRADLDQVEALSGEREALWGKLEKATFLSRAEKRAAAGYGGDNGTQEVGGKFNPHHDDAGRFTDAEGAVDPKVSDGRIRLAQIEGARQYAVDLNQEEDSGGHTKRDHVGKTDQYLLGEVTKVRARILFFELGNRQEGSFSSLETANDFVNRTLEDNKVLVDQVARGDLSEVTLNKRFGFSTGKEGFKPDGASDAYVRPTYGVCVRILHDDRAERGYRVQTAFPRNEISNR